MDVDAKITKEVGMDNVVFEATDPVLLQRYIKNYGIDVNSSSTIRRSCSLSACGAASGATRALLGASQRTAKADARGSIGDRAGRAIGRQACLSLDWGLRRRLAREIRFKGGGDRLDLADVAASSGLRVRGSEGDDGALRCFCRPCRRSSC